MNLSPADERHIAWRKSSYSGGSGSGNCVEVAGNLRRVVVRDSKNPFGGNLTIGAGPWKVLVAQIKQGRLDP